MLGDSGGLGSIAGMLIVNNWLVRRRRLQLEGLYLADGTDRDRNGWNWNAVTATGTGCALAWGGLVVPVLARDYAYGWFVGFLRSNHRHSQIGRAHV